MANHEVELYNEISADLKAMMQALDKAPYDPENPYSSSLGEGISA